MTKEEEEVKENCHMLITSLLNEEAVIKKNGRQTKKMEDDLKDILKKATLIGCDIIVN